MHLSRAKALGDLHVNITSRSEGWLLEGFPSPQELEPWLVWCEGFWHKQQGSPTTRGVVLEANHTCEQMQEQRDIGVCRAHISFILVLALMFFLTTPTLQHTCTSSYVSPCLHIGVWHMSMLEAESLSTYLSLSISLVLYISLCLSTWPDLPSHHTCSLQLLECSHPHRHLNTWCCSSWPPGQQENNETLTNIEAQRDA